ncbi:hypothetical protein [Synechococcus elongatus]|uniref:O-antigen ligase family protein n=1 Tax=Synechococcus elongatus TaxID=32046 RepID=UPI0030CF90F3
MGIGSASDSGPLAFINRDRWQSPDRNSYSTEEREYMALSQLGQSQRRLVSLPLWIASGLLPLWPEVSLAGLGVWLALTWRNSRDRALSRTLIYPLAIATLLCGPALIRGWSVWQAGMLWLTGLVVSGVLLLTDQRRQELIESLSLAPVLSLPAVIWTDSLNEPTLALGWGVTGLWAIATVLTPKAVPSGRWLTGLAAAIGLGGSWWLGSFGLRLGLLVGLFLLALQQSWGQRLWHACTRSPLRRLGLISLGVGSGLIWPFPTTILDPGPQGLLWRCAQDQIQHNTLRWLTGRGTQYVAETCANLTGVPAENMSGLLQLWAELGLLGLTAVFTLGIVTGDRYRQLLTDSALPRSQLSGGLAGLAVLALLLPFDSHWLTGGLTPVLLGVSLAIPWTRSRPLRLPAAVDWLLLAALALQVNSAFWAAPLAWSWLVIRLIEQLHQRDWRGLFCWAAIALLFLPPLFWAKPTFDPSVSWSAYVLLGLGLIGATGLGRDRSLRLLRWIGLLPLLWLLANLQAIDWTIRIGMGDLYINQVGILTVIATVPALLLTWHDRSWRGLYLLSTLAGTILVLGTASRICLGALVLVLGLTVVLNLRTCQWRSLLWLLPSIGLFGLGLAGLRPDLVGRYLEFYDPARLAIARCYATQAWINWPLSFWVGNGYSQAAAICQPPLTLNRVSHAHNFVLQLLADNGVLVLAIVLLGLALTLARLWQQTRSAREEADLLLGQWLLISLVIGVVLHLFEGSFFKLPLLQLLIGLVLGLPWLGNLTPVPQPTLQGRPVSDVPLV